MLGITPKRSAAVDFTKPLTTYIKDNFSKDEAKNVSSAINSVQQKRNVAVQMCANSAADPAKAREAMEEYLAEFTTVSSRFPFGRQKGSSFFRSKATAVMVPFTWVDSFRPEKQGTDYTADFEKAACIFNIGAFHSLAGIKEDRSVAAGLVKAYKHFQASAGVFTYLATNSDYASPLTVDVSTVCFKMLSHLMLAQAQACYFEMAVSKKMSPSLVSKLAQGTAALFHHAIAAANQSPLSEWLNKSKYQWIQHFIYQQKCFEAASHHWDAKQLLKKDEYGKEIARLYAAKDACAEAGKYEGRVVAGLKESRSKLYSMIVERLAEAVKDNESIYHYSVPALNELPAIEQKFVVKAVPWTPPQNDATEEAFSGLIPLQISEDASMYMAQLTSTCSEMSKECQEAADYAKMHLSSLNLPAALEAMAPEKGFPDHVWERVREIQFKGGAKGLDECVKSLTARATEAWDMLESIKEKLHKEAEEDTAMRVQWKAQWNRVPSSQISASFNRDADMVEQYLRSAGNSDQGVLKELDQNRGSLLMLESSRAELSSQLPDVSSASTETPASKKLKQLLDELSALLEHRMVLVQTFEKSLQEEDIVPSLLAAKGKKPTDQVFAEERKKFEEQQKDIASALDRQKGLLEQITAANDEFVSTKKTDHTQEKRQEVLQKVNVAADLYNKLMSNLNEGVKFYSDIVKDFLTPLQQTVDDFVMARGQEKQIILEQITSDLAKRGPSSSVSAPSGYQLPPSMGAPAAASAPPSYQPAPAYAPSYQPPPAANPNMAFQSGNNYPSPAQMSGYSRPQLPGPPGGPAAAPTAADAKSEFACPSCTFINPGTAMVCSMCNTENPNPAPPRKADAQPANADDSAKKGGWRSFFS